MSRASAPASATGCRAARRPAPWPGQRPRSKAGARASTPRAPVRSRMTPARAGKQHPVARTADDPPTVDVKAMIGAGQMGHTRRHLRPGNLPLQRTGCLRARCVPAHRRRLVGALTVIGDRLIFSGGGGPPATRTTARNALRNDASGPSLATPTSSTGVATNRETDVTSASRAEQFSGSAAIVVVSFPYCPPNRVPVNLVGDARVGRDIYGPAWAATTQAVPWSAACRALQPAARVFLGSKNGVSTTVARAGPSGASTSRTVPVSA